MTGPTRNPWHTDHVPGRSSSGSGAAVAARLVFGALGSDTGGSIRIPAACCGLVGVKPTYGRVSRYAALPLSFSLDSIGPLAQTTADAALILQVIAGHDPRDATSSGRPVHDLLAALDTRPNAVAGTANPLTNLMIAVEGAAVHRTRLTKRPDDYGSQTPGRLLPGLLTPATAYVDALEVRKSLTAEFCNTVFSRVDILHTPVMPLQVPTIAASDLAANPGFTEFLIRAGHCTRPVNFLGLPAVSVPAGFTANGLPTGFQLVGSPFDEALLPRAAYAYERAAGWPERAPPL